MLFKILFRKGRQYFSTYNEITGIDVLVTQKDKASALYSAYIWKLLRIEVIWLLATGQNRKVIERILLKSHKL